MSQKNNVVQHCFCDLYIDQFSYEHGPDSFSTDAVGNKFTCQLEAPTWCAFKGQLDKDACKSIKICAKPCAKKAFCSIISEKGFCLIHIKTGDCRAGDPNFNKNDKIIITAPISRKQQDGP